MTRTPTSVEVLAQVKARLERAINDGIRELLERKHLYQSFKLDSALADAELSAFQREQLSILREYFANYTAGAWQIEPAVAPGGPPLRRLTDRPDVPHVAVDGAKLFCGKCERVEAYNLVYASELYGEMEKYRVSIRRGVAQQTIVLAYECQSCKQPPEVFMFARNGLRVTLVGRSPMEHVQVPDVVPKSHRKFFSDAIIAYQAGQILPALFMLRTFIEQFAASTTPPDPSLRADEVLDRYMSSLNDAVRAHFPSPRDIYARLSVAIHSANADPGLFERSVREVVRHFEARQLYGAA